jgi:hypothetical protein
MTFSAWVRSGREAAETWANAMPPGETRDLVQGQLARTLAMQKEFADAAKVISQLEDRVDPKVLVGIAHSWTEKDSAAAADWAIGLPAGPLQSRALATVVSSWANVDPNGVQGWLAQFPAGETRDASITAFLSRNSAWIGGPERQQAEFQAWFDVIEDPWQRAKAARSFYWRRRTQNPKAAREWLAGLPNVDATVIAMTLRGDEE